MASRTAKYQITGEQHADSRSNQLKILEFGSRYARPQDDTTILSVFHRTTGGSNGVLLEQDDFRALSRWLDGDREPYTVGGPPEGIDTLYFRRRTVAGQSITFRDTQTTAVLTTGEEALPDEPRGLTVRISWNGSGQERGIVLSGPQVDQMTQWMRDRVAQGWTGWRSGVR